MTIDVIFTCLAFIRIADRTVNEVHNVSVCKQTVCSCVWISTLQWYLYSLTWERKPHDVYCLMSSIAVSRSVQRRAVSHCNKGVVLVQNVDSWLQRRVTTG
jgi:hypothetical protein